MDSTNQRFVDTREASRITGIPVSTLVTWRSRSTNGPPYYVIPNSNRIRYEVTELLSWMMTNGQMSSTAEYQVIPKESDESSSCNDPQGSDDEDSDDPQ